MLDINPRLPCQLWFPASMCVCKRRRPLVAFRHVTGNFRITWHSKWKTTKTPRLSGNLTKTMRTMSSWKDAGQQFVAIQGDQFTDIWCSLLCASLVLVSCYSTYNLFTSNSMSPGCKKVLVSVNAQICCGSWWYFSGNDSTFSPLFITFVYWLSYSFDM